MYTKDNEKLTLVCVHLLLKLHCWHLVHICKLKKIKDKVFIIQNEKFVHSEVNMQITVSLNAHLFVRKDGY